MCDDQALCSQNMSQSVATRQPQIVLRRVEEMFPALKGSVSCTVSLEALPGSYSEASATSCTSNADEVMSIKVEDDTDTHSQTMDFPVCISCPVIKAEQDERCTVSLEALPGSYSEAGGTSCNIADEFMSIKVEDSTDTHLQPKEIPVGISCPVIKAEQDESCTVSLEALPVSSSVASATSCNNTYEVMGIKVEDGTDTHLQPKEIHVCISRIKAEQDESSLNESQISHDEEQPYPFCMSNTPFSQQSSLKRQHRGERSYTCDVCHKSFTQKRRLKVHLCTHSGEHPFTCNVCSKSFIGQNNLKLHERTHSGERPYMCGICNKSFTQKGNLNAHQRTHSGVRPFNCATCNKSFTRKAHLKEHQDLHSGERPFRCGACNKSFTRKAHLKLHQHTHSGERPFRCAMCNKSFNQKDYLKVHQHTHSGEHPFRCGTCNKAYTWKAQLKVHQRMHSGERPFRCGMCNKSFTRKGVLKVHQRTHSGERPFMCDMCNKSFTQKSSLKQHQCRHNGERPFRCGMCNKSFTQKYNLKVHQRTHT